MFSEQCLLPAARTSGLRLAADDGEEEFGADAANFVRSNFNVEDGLTSIPTASDAIELVIKTQDLCFKAGIRLHKFASNYKEELESLAPEDRAKSVERIELHDSSIEHIVGFEWKIQSGTFQFKVKLLDRPPTTRGILSAVSQVFDPLGFLAPVILIGKRILQDIFQQQYVWDAPLPGETIRWEIWKRALHYIQNLSIPRCVQPTDFEEIVSVEIHHFCDASTIGYGQCSYLRSVCVSGRVHCCLLTGKNSYTSKNYDCSHIRTLCSCVVTKDQQVSQKSTRV